MARSRSLHITFISVAGIEDAAHHLPYYRAKLECEAALTSSGVAHCIVRATQFHEFAEAILKTLSIGPFLVKPSLTLQPLDVSFAAQITAEAAVEAREQPLTLSGPEALAFEDLARTWHQHQRRRAMQIPVPSIGPLRALATLRTVSGTTGGTSWAEWVAGQRRAEG